MNLRDFHDHFYYTPSEDSPEPPKTLRAVPRYDAVSEEPQEDAE